MQHYNVNNNLFQGKVVCKVAVIPSRRLPLNDKMRFFASLRMTREELILKESSWFVILSETKDLVFLVCNNLLLFSGLS